MHVIGERVLYSSNGVMEIADIRDEEIGDTSRRYYVLNKLDSTSSAQIFVPVDNEKLVGNMFPVLTKEEALDLISRAPSIQELDWPTSSRARADKFQSVLDSGDRERIIALIKAIHNNGERRKLEGKRNFLSDDAIMLRAKRLIYSELALVLEKSEEEFSDFIFK